MKLNKSQGKLIRIGQILRILMEKEHISCVWLSKQFQTTPRTIQRDLLLLKTSGFPVHEISKGSYSLKKDLLKNFEVFDDTELAVIIALKNLVGQLGAPFQQAAENVLDRLSDTEVNMPVFIRIDEPVSLDMSLFNKIVRAISQKKKVSFQYASIQKGHIAKIEPYKVVHFSGFWYLIGLEIDTGIIKRYALDKISGLKVGPENFKKIPSNLDRTLKESSSIWFTGNENIEIVILVDAERSHYFKRRKMYPTQKILEEKTDGSIVVSYRVGHWQEIWTMIKSWIPYVMILKPKDLNDKLLVDVRQWISWQKEIS